MLGCPRSGCHLATNRFCPILRLELVHWLVQELQVSNKNGCGKVEISEINQFEKTAVMLFKGWIQKKAYTVQNNLYKISLNKMSIAGLPPVKLPIRNLPENEQYF